MSTTVLGKVSMTPKGAWNASTSYEPLDVVSYGGSAFLARRANSNVTPTEGADWQMIAEKGGGSSINYSETKTVYLGDNVLGSATIGEGWTESGAIYTHASGYDADLTFETSVEEGSIYILEFDSNFTRNEFVRVGIGDMYRVLCYQGQSHITVPLMASGGTTLYITPIDKTYAGSISNITLRKIQESGTECVLDLYSTTTNNHAKNYGFWNTFIGKNTAENAVGTTRSIAIGYYTLNSLQGGHRNIGIGTYAMSQLIGGEENVSIGSDSMLAVQKAEACIAIGMSGMYEGASHKGDIAIGKCALYGNSTSQTENNIAIGAYAGNKLTNAKRNVFIGTNAGYNATSGAMNTFIGSNAGQNGTSWGSTAIGAQADTGAYSASIAIGYQAKATKSDQAVIGGDTIVETLLKGNLIVRGTDGTKRQIVFNNDGTVTWAAIST